MSHKEKKGIGISQEAIDMAYILYENESNPHIDLRVSVEGGGCSGFSYKFIFDSENNKDDFVLELKENLNLRIDFLSFQYLVGSLIDFENNIDGARFFIKNPNAKTTCGCGNSFSL